VGRRGRKKKKEREESCWAGPRGEGERGLGGLESFGFFSKTFQVFSNFKFKLFLIFSNFQNILKLHTNKQKHHAFKL
jgi:hypothetical protein